MNLLESKGIKRTLASVFAVLAAAAPAVAFLEPHVALLSKLAALFGGVGIAHAGVKKIKE